MKKASHARADDRYLGDIRISDDILRLYLAGRLLDYLQAPFEILFRDREGKVGVRVLAYVLDYHVHIDPGFGKRAEELCRYPRPVGHPQDRNLGLVLVVGDARDYNFFHFLVLLADKGPGGGIERTPNHPM